ncbi:MAG TPA: ATP phosphoribosyltransferase regulatory subunit [Dehalococcoidia bacterium]|nr:ATP phosphoribosyltransferase regulatory subunit [Dehalococcoidia bacterium]
MKAVSDLQSKGATLQNSWLRRRHIQDRLLQLIGSHGYQFLEIPILAPAELFLRKSGGELASQMFSFLDPGSNFISLRPEFTAPIMLHYLAHSDEVALPARWHYAGPVFRYDGANPNGNGQFTQIGAELIGSTSVMADAELVGLAAEMLDAVGVQGYEVRLADLQVLHDLLDTVGISDRARTFIIGIIPELRNGIGNNTSLLERAQYLHLTGNSPQEHDLRAAVAGLDDDLARQVLRGFLHWSGGGEVGVGQRDPDEVIEGLLHKIRGSDDRDGLERALNLVSVVTRIHGGGVAAIKQARAVLGPAGARSDALDRLSELIELLQCYPGLADNLVLDFGLARGIAYYNGITFQVTHPGSGATLGGGGRYDALARALGSAETVPALGFACNLDLLARLAGENASGDWSGPAGLLSWPSSALVIAEVPGSRMNALAAARELRHSGLKVEMAVGDVALSDALTYAAKNGLSQVVVAGPSGPWQAHQVGSGR